MSFSQADILVYEDASAAYVTNSSYVVDGSVAKARLFNQAILNLLRFPEQVEKDGERAKWNLVILEKQLQRVEEFLSYADESGANTQVQVTQWCRE